MARSLHFCGSFYVQANAAFLNGFGTEKIGKSDVSWPKYIDIQGVRIPYVSAQAYRRWIKLTVENELPLFKNKYGFIDKFEKYKGINIYDDLFGTFLGKKVDLSDTTNIDAKNAGIIRESPLKISPLVSVSKTDFQFTRENAFVHMLNDSPLPYSSTFYNTDLEAFLGVAISRIGNFRIFQDRQEIDSDSIPKGLESGLDTPEKKEYQLTDYKAHVIARLDLLLTSLVILTGGAKLTQYGVDASPKVIIGAIQCGGNPILTKLVKLAQGGPILDISELKSRIESGKKLKLFLSPVFVAYRKNYFVNEEEIASFILSIKGTEMEKTIKFITPMELIRNIVNWVSANFEEE